VHNAGYADSRAVAPAQERGSDLLQPQPWQKKKLKSHCPGLFIRIHANYSRALTFLFFLLTDTSPEFYPKITSSRTYDDRLDTLGKVRGLIIDYDYF
jgi:hypothetical protein